MASCAFAQLAGGPCGPSAHNPALVECVVLGNCDKDIQGHLIAYRVYGDHMLDSEATLVLARAGKGESVQIPKYVQNCNRLYYSLGVFEIRSRHLVMTICPRHRDLYGIRWRSNKRSCSAPTSWSLHSSKVKGDRGITLSQSKQLFQSTGVLVPVASRKYYQAK